MTAGIVQFYELPEHKRYVGHEGYVYVAELSSGLVKVGRTVNPRGRIDAHRKNAASYGIEVLRIWLSVRHVNYSDNEQALIRRLGHAENGNEYFRQPFEEVAAAAGALRFEIATAGQREEWAEEDRRRSRAFASLYGRELIEVPDGMQAIFIPGDLMAWPLQTIFNRQLPEALRRSSAEDVGPLIDDLAEKSSLSRETILHWSYADFLRHLANLVVESGVQDFRYRALVDGRTDLASAPFFGSAVSS